MSIIGGILAITTERYYMWDYWKPQYMSGFSLFFADFLFGFSVAGVAATLYDAVFQKKKILKSGKAHYLIFFVLLISNVAFLYAGSAFTSINSMYLCYISVSLILVVILSLRWDLWKISLTSGLLLGIIYLVLFRVLLISLYPHLITHYWIVQNLSGIYIDHVPLEEVVWAIFTGSLFGPAWKFMTGTRV